MNKLTRTLDSKFIKYKPNNMYKVADTRQNTQNKKSKYRNKIIIYEVND